MKSFIKELAMEIYDFIFPKISKNYDFDSISSILQNKTFVQNNKKFFSNLDINLNHKQIKIFLSAFLIKYCPDDIFLEKREMENILISKSSAIISLYLSLLTLRSFNESIVSIFNTEVIDYVNFFEKWKNYDKRKLLFVLCSSYHELILTENTLKNENDEFCQKWKLELLSQKKSLENYIYKIGGEKAIDNLLDGSFWMEIITPEMKESIEMKTKDKLKMEMINELNNQQKPFLIIKLLKEIKRKLSRQTDNLGKLEKESKLELLNMDLPANDYIKIIKMTLKLYLDLCQDYDELQNINIMEINSNESLVEIMEKINLIIK